MITKDDNATQLSAQAMAALVAERCPTMSPAAREAVLTGSVLTLASGESYQAPVLEHSRPTHTAVLPLKCTRTNDGEAKWIN